MYKWVQSSFPNRSYFLVFSCWSKKVAQPESQTSRRARGFGPEAARFLPGFSNQIPTPKTLSILSEKWENKRLESCKSKGILENLVIFFHILTLNITSVKFSFNLFHFPSIPLFISCNFLLDLLYFPLKFCFISCNLPLLFLYISCNSFLFCFKLWFV